MCGIAGMVQFAGLDGDAVRPRLAAALSRLAPRGPDGDGFWADARCALGHRRLAIVDLSPAGAQPMVRGGLTLVFNGMIYNYRQLRDELAAAGHAFASDTDTEVILAGWQAWGEALLPRLVGMFAFALWDAAAGCLWLARDRFGQKPLAWAQRRGGIAFASEVQALRALDPDLGGLDAAALGAYCALGYVPESQAILAGVNKVAPGHLVRADAAGAEHRRWYAFAGGAPDGLPEAYADEAQAVRDLRGLVETAVADRLVADVPVGAFLSGGIDSAIVTACMQRAAPAVRTFTVGFEGVPDYYEERPAAREVAAYLGTEHTEISVDAGEALAVIDRVFDGLDEPFADSSAVPTWLVSRETRRHVTVALSGDGGDEVFGGYRKYQGELHAAAYHRWPGLLRRGVVEPLARLLPEGKGHPLTEKFRRVRRFVAHAGGDAIARQSGWARLLTDDALGALLAAPQTPDIANLYAAARGQDTSGDPVNAMLAGDIGVGLPGDMLVKVDRMSMAHGLEVRSPFLDHRVVACAARMPGAFKLRRGVGKHVLREAFRGDLPAAVFDRPKKGFEIPVAEWLTGPLRERTLDAISPDRLRRQGLFRPDLPQRWFALLDSRRRDTAAQLWMMISFQAWWDRFQSPPRQA